MLKVITGVKPDRPLSGFSDALWDLLLTVWDPEHGSQPPRRPPIQTILNQMKGDAVDWDRFIVPPVEEEESCAYLTHSETR